MLKLMVRTLPGCREDVAELLKNCSAESVVQLPKGLERMDCAMEATFADATALDAAAAAIHLEYEGIAQALPL